MRCFLFVLSCLVAVTLGQPPNDATPWDIILRYGFPVENHWVPTQDGYMLNVQRIPNVNNPNAAVVYLQHGLLDSSATWVMNEPAQSLAFILSKAGFDVWLGNQRGNRYSQRMVNGSSFNWYFSMDQMAQYDDDALLKYITQATGKAKIAWVGHSRGTQQMFYGLSRFPQHANYINVFIALAPVAWVGNVESLLLKVLAHIDTGDIFDTIGYHDFLSSAYGAEDLCLFCSLCCDDLIGAIMGPGVHNATRFNQTRMQFYLHHFPAGTSAMEMAHYAQLVVNNDVQLYDYGTDGNEQHYGTPNAPMYNLTNIPSSVPIALFTGSQDYLANPTDVARLVKTMGGPSRFTLIHNEPNWDHADFVWGLQAASRIYPTVIDLIKQFA